MILMILIPKVADSAIGNRRRWGNGWTHWPEHSCPERPPRRRSERL